VEHRCVGQGSGVTVRTLHYCDQIGVVSPGERTAAGHRRYRDADIRRLYRVRTLVGLGLPLAEFATVPHDATDDLIAMRDLLTAQLAELDPLVGFDAAVHIDKVTPWHTSVPATR
jgi:DNA-binding transcriptional MerR regulator